MTTYYLDTSALIKRYVQETGTDWMRALVAPTAGHTLLTARVTMVEIYSALARRRREGSVPAADCATDYDFIELDLNVVALARDLLEQHPLRAYDAIQLASALFANQALETALLPFEMIGEGALNHWPDLDEELSVAGITEPARCEGRPTTVALTLEGYTPRQAAGWLGG